jgi:hypothetical protein
MKRFLAFLLDLSGRLGHRSESFHNGSLRANQPNEPAYNFGYWRSLVS